MRIGKRRACVIAIGIASVLLLTQSVTTLSERLAERSTAIIEYRSLNNDDSASPEEIQRKVRQLIAANELLAGSDSVKVEQVSEGEFLIYTEGGAARSIRDDIEDSVTMSNLGRTYNDIDQLMSLNDLKSSLESRVSELPDSSGSAEKENILNLITDIDQRIASIINGDNDEGLEEKERSLERSFSVPESSENSDEPASSTGVESEESTEPASVENESPKKSYLLQSLKWLCYFIATVVGIFFKAMWDSPNLKSLFSFKNIKPILIAPIVFYGVYATVNTLTDDLLAVLIAFQNGFFWQSILKAEQSKHEMPSTQTRLASASASSTDIAIPK